MPFNHYAKIKHILSLQPSGWIIKKINEPTNAKNFKDEIVNFKHYYRIYSSNNEPIKYCKFQQIERLAKILKVNVEELPVID